MNRLIGWLPESIPIDSNRLIVTALLCITTNVFPLPCKSFIVTPLIKKPGLDAEILKNYRPVSNLSFLSKVIEKVIASRIISHIENNAIIDKFQSAYKCGHSTETALLRVYSDIVTTIGKGNGSFLVLLDLSAAFDTIDHSNLFDILEKYVGITGDALQLIKSYFSDCSQSTRIESIMSDIVHIICGVPQDSVLGPLKFCIQLLPLGAILRYHGIGYHIYADDTQLYLSFKCDNPSITLSKLNPCTTVCNFRWFCKYQCVNRMQLSLIYGISGIFSTLTFDCTHSSRAW